VKQFAWLTKEMKKTTAKEVAKTVLPKQNAEDLERYSERRSFVGRVLKQVGHCNVCSLYVSILCPRFVSCFYRFYGSMSFDHVLLDEAWGTARADGTSTIELSTSTKLPQYKRPIKILT